MRILFDHGAPRGVSAALKHHEVKTAFEKGWDELSNGALLTTDRRIQYQQNLKDRKIVIVVLTGSTKWSQVQLHLERIAAAVDACGAGNTLKFRYRFQQGRADEN
jgi:hypothetical protein